MMLSIDEVILQVRKENEEALRLLFIYLEKYLRSYENKMIYSFKYPENMREDLRIYLQEITLNIIDLYEMDKGNFYSFWKMIITQKMIKYYQVNNNELAIINKQTNLDAEKLDYWDIGTQEPLDDYLLKDEYNKILEDVEKNFDDRCSYILRLWSEGYSYNQIAVKLNISYQVVTYSIYKSIKFLKESFKNKK